LDKITVPYLVEALVFLLAASTIAPLFKKMKLSPVLGYLVAGSLIGPYAFGLVDDIDRIQAVADLGVIFLMFIIGLELPIERLKVMRRWIFGLGSAQVLLTTMVLSGVCLAFNMSMEASIVTGGALALSSTALVVQLLSERHEVQTKFGRATFGTLLAQDIAVVPLLTMTLLFAGAEEGASMGMTLLNALGKAIIALGGIFLIGRYALRPIYGYFASINDDELFLGATLMIILAVSAFTGYMGLSMALGAFLAGMLIAETEYRHKVEADILPFQGLLLGLFFMAVGMTVDYGMVADNLALIVQLVFGLMAIKGVLVFMLARSFGLNNKHALRTATFLAQGGEFAFVVLKVAMMQDLMPLATGQMLFVVVAISMAATPLFVEIAATFSHRGQAAADTSLALDEIAGTTQGLNGHVVLVGFGRVGKTVASILEQQSIAYAALDMDAKHVRDANKQGLPVYYGNAAREDLLEAIGADRAQVAVVTLDSPKASRAVIKTLRQHFPHLRIMVRGKDEGDCKELVRLGAEAAVPETASASVQLGKAVVSAFGQNPGTRINASTDDEDNS
jgi:CPA2 family monovalent cation:H+ antiporter-2